MRAIRQILYVPVDHDHDWEVHKLSLVNLKHIIEP